MNRDGDADASQERPLDVRLEGKREDEDGNRDRKLGARPPEHIDDMIKPDQRQDGDYHDHAERGYGKLRKQDQGVATQEP